MARGRTRPTYTSHHNFSPRLCPKRSFRLPSPYMQMSSINRYPNGTSVNNRDRRWNCGYSWNWYLRKKYYLVQKFFVNNKITTAPQLRISKGGTMGPMNLSQWPYNNKLSSTGKCVRVYIPALRSKGSHRLSILCSSAYDWFQTLNCYMRILGSYWSGVVNLQQRPLLVGLFVSSLFGI